MRFAPLFFVLSSLASLTVCAAQTDNLSRLETACENGDASSCFKLGLRYSDNDTDPKSDKKSAEYFRKACEGGMSEGCFNLALCYEYGKGVTKSAEKAGALYEKACQCDIFAACTNLGAIHFDKKLIPKL